MHERGPSIVDGQPGFAPQVGRLVAMLAYARRTTLKAVEGLTAAQLDHPHDPLSNSIDALLARGGPAPRCRTHAGEGRNQHAVTVDPT